LRPATPVAGPDDVIAALVVSGLGIRLAQGEYSVEAEVVQGLFSRLAQASDSRGLHGPLA
jgi:hypothetical protein